VGRPGQHQYNIYAGQRRLNAEPIFSGSFNIATNVVEDAEYTVETVSKIAGGRSSIIGQPLPSRTGPVFALAPDRGRLVGPAVFDGNELDLSQGGHFVVAANEEFNMQEGFRLECFVKFDEPGASPVLLSHGLWGGDGWFLQKFNGRWRFYADRVVCDGGAPRIGEWLHIVVTFDGVTIRLYENDRLIVQRPASPNQNPWLEDLVIGQYNRPSEGHQFRGRIRDVRIGYQVPSGGQ